MIIICWLASLIVAIPQLFIFEQSSIPRQTSKYRCASTGYTGEWQRRVYFSTFACYLLIIPVIFMTVCYVKIIRTVAASTKVWIQKVRGQTTTAFLSSPASSPAKIKTVKLAMTIIIVFTISWTPYILFTLIEIYTDRAFRLPNWLDGVLQTICFAQSGVNPLIYIVFNRQRKGSPTIILSARTSSSTCRQSGQQSHRSSSMSSTCLETSFHSNGYYQVTSNVIKRNKRTESFLLL